MVAESKKKHTNNRSRANRVLFPAIGLAAEAFGISRATLWRALTGAGPAAKSYQGRYAQFIKALDRKAAAR